MKLTLEKLAPFKTSPLPFFYTAEASELGLSPRSLPRSIEIDIDGKTATLVAENYHPNDSLTYKALDRLLVLRVLND